MNERSLTSTVFMRSSALLRVSRAFRVGTISSSLAYKRHSSIRSLTTRSRSSVLPTSVHPRIPEYLPV
jgi:hypothetical protein